MKPTLVLTTQPLKFSDQEAFEKITISPLLSQKDIKAISNYLKTVRTEFIQPKFPEDIKQYFEEDLFFPDLAADTPDEAIEIMFQKLRQKGYVLLKLTELIQSFK